MTLPLCQRSDELAWCILLSWNWDEGVNKDRFIQHFLNIVPEEFRDQAETSIDAKGWPAFISYTKLFALIAKRGMKPLEGASVLGVKGQKFIYLDFWYKHKRTRFIGHFNKVKVCIESIHDIFRDLVLTQPCTYGICYRTMFAENALSKSRITFGESAEPDITSMNIYLEARYRWDINQGLSKPQHPEYYLKYLTFVSPFNALTREHLDTPIPALNCTLEQWIQADPRRGTLEAVTNTNTIWKVERHHLEHVVSTLWPTGIFPVSEHFVITGWSADLDIPQLAARRSVRPLLSTPSQQSTKYID